MRQTPVGHTKYLDRVQPFIGDAPTAGVDEARAYRERMIAALDSRHPDLTPDLREYLKRRIRDWRDRANGTDHRWATVGARPGILPAALRLQVQHATDYDAAPTDADVYRPPGRPRKAEA